MSHLLKIKACPLCFIFVIVTGSSMDSSDRSLHIHQGNDWLDSPQRTGQSQTSDRVWWCDAVRFSDRCLYNVPAGECVLSLHWVLQLTMRWLFAL